ncbi:MAG: hypothetical protein ACPG8W_05150 [Candidatus Promineifilaceae bacterium]
MANRSAFMYFVIGGVIGILLGSILQNPVAGLAIGLGVAGAGYFLGQRNGGAPSFGGGRSAGRGAYQALLAKARGDKSLAERLITYEQKRNPGGSRNEWAADALDRWNRDRS